MKILEITFSLLLISVTCFGFKPFKSSELKKSPEEISKLVTNDLLSRPEFMMYKAQDVKVVYYAEACAGFGAIKLAGLMNDKEIFGKLAARKNLPKSLCKSMECPCRIYRE